MATIDTLSLVMIIAGTLALAISVYTVTKAANEYLGYRRTLKRFLDYINQARSLCNEMHEGMKETIETIDANIEKAVEEKLRQKLPETTKLSDYGKYTKFNDPGQSFEGDTIKIHQVLPDGNVLCQIISHDYNGKVHGFQNAFLPMKDGKKFKYYDGQEITLPEDAVIFQTGTFQYPGGMTGTPVTVPAIRIFGFDDNDNDTGTKKGEDHAKNDDH